MNRKKFFSLVCVWLASGSFCFAATVPAGTAILVRTNAGISTNATPGGHFTATLEQNVVANGDVVLRAGTQLTGTIKTSRGSRSTSRSEPLGLILNSASANGHTVHIKTNLVHPEPPKTTRSSRGSFSFGEDTFPPGTRLEFRLTQPVNL